MYEITIVIKAIRTNKDIDEQPRIYIKIDHFHYFISSFLPLKAEQTELNIDHKFYLPEDKPAFQLMLLLQSTQKKKKVLGRALLDIRQWPINQLKCRVIPFSEIIYVVLSMQYSYKSAILSQQHLEQSQIDIMEQAQEQLQIKEQHSFLKSKNKRLLAELEKLKNENKRLVIQKQKTQDRQNKRKEERQRELQWRLDDLNQHKWQLQQMNLQIGAIINLVNDHGQIDICNSVLEILANDKQ